MKEEIRVSAIQIASGQTIYDNDQKDLNVEKIIGHLEREALNSDLIVFPELSITGYIPLRGYVPELKSKFWEISEDTSNSAVLEKIQETTHKLNCISIVGFSERSIVKYETFNSAALFAAIIAAVGELSILSDLTTCPPLVLAIVSVPVISVI